MVLGGQGAEAHGNLDNPSAIANVGLNYVTISSYHARPSASTSLCGPGAVFSPRPTSFQFLLFPGLDFSEARCLLATGAGGFRLPGLFQTPVFNAVLIRSLAVAFCCHLLCGRLLAELSGVALGRRFRQEGVAMKKPRK